MKLPEFFMTGFGSGYAPLASGTFGSAAACAVAVVAWFALGGTEADPVALSVMWIVLTTLSTVGCVAWGPWAVEFYAGRERKKGDPGQVVLDEFAGQFIALIALPLTSSWQHAVLVVAVQFFLFRCFDVAKLAPARQLERLPKGWGIVADDLAAGVYANMIGQVLFRVFW